MASGILFGDADLVCLWLQFPGSAKNLVPQARRVVIWTTVVIGEGFFSDEVVIEAQLD